MQRNPSLLARPRHKQFRRLLKYGRHLHLVRAAHVRDAGSLLQHLAELIVPGVLGSKSLHKENKRILQPGLDQEKKIMALLANVSDASVKSRLLAGVPVMELPILVCPNRRFEGWRSKSLSEREKARKSVYGTFITPPPTIVVT